MLVVPFGRPVTQTLILAPKKYESDLRSVVRTLTVRYLKVAVLPTANCWLPAANAGVLDPAIAVVPNPVKATARAVLATTHVAHSRRFIPVPPVLGRCVPPLFVRRPEQWPQIPSLLLSRSVAET
jgi:hypothetical protein